MFRVVACCFVVLVLVWRFGLCAYYCHGLLVCLWCLRLGAGLVIWCCFELLVSGFCYLGVDAVW